MTSRDFCYWLQGFFEINGSSGNKYQDVTSGQVECIQKHLKMVFVTEIDPSFKPAITSALNDIHNPGGAPVMRC